MIIIIIKIIIIIIIIYYYYLYYYYKIYLKLRIQIPEQISEELFYKPKMLCLCEKKQPKYVF